MRKYLPLFFLFTFLAFAVVKAIPTYAQSVVAKPDTSKIATKKNWAIGDLKKRSNDHFILNFGGVIWTGDVDGLNMSGFGHSYGISFFYDMPFRTNPHFSIAPGIGINLNRVYFDSKKTDVVLGGSTMQFNPVTEGYSDVQGFFYNNLEAGLELRYISNPARSERSFKIALGFKLGLTFDAIDYRFNLYDKDGNRTFTGIQEFHDARFLHFPHSTVTFRVGYGVVGVYASYQVTDLFSTASQGPKINPINVGLVLSGL